MTYAVNRMHVQNQQVAGQIGQNSSAGAHITLNLNTVVTNDITGASLAANAITLPAGTYYINAYYNSYKARATRMQLYNNTAAAIAILGRCVYGDSSNGEPIMSLGNVITITEESAFILRAWSQDTESGGYGQDVDATIVEIYGDVLIEQLA